MTKKASSLQFAGQGQPETPAAEPVTEQAAAPQAQPGNDQPVYVTKAEFDEAVSDIKRLAQSMTGKAEARIQKQLAALQSVGIQATTEQVEKLVADAEKEAAAQEPRMQPQNQPPQQQPAQAAAEAEDLDPVTRKAYRILREAGIDPEQAPALPDWNVVNLDTDDPEEFLGSVRSMAAAHQKRSEAAGSPAKLPTLSSAPAGPGGSKETIQRELETLLKSPVANFARIKELQGKLAQYK